MSWRDNEPDFDGSFSAAAGVVAILVIFFLACVPVWGLEYFVWQMIK